MAREELKVNIIIKGDHIFLGAQATDCDAKMTTLKGTLQNALDRVPSFVEESNQQWAAAPRNAKSTLLEPVAKAPVRVSTTPTTTASKPGQPNFF